MYDRFNRHINYLRISVTDRCNLRCTYCMPESGISLLPRMDILSFEEITEVVKIAVTLGIDRIRLTGGEPLVRKDITRLISMIAAVHGVKDLSLTTNGILLEQFALPLKKAGLHRINISLDTMNPDHYSFLTRGGDMNRVLRGIDAAIDARLDPIKINCVVFKNSEIIALNALKEFCRKKNLQLRLIHEMNLETGDFSIVEGGKGGDCEHCNRLRITANGMVKPCLFDEQEFSIRKLGVKQALEMALECKPLKGCLNRTGQFYNIGG